MLTRTTKRKRTKSQCTRLGQAGFTLVEMMTVVAIIGTLSTTAFIYLDHDKRGRTVEGYAESLGLQFEMARQRAIATQKQQEIIIDSDGFQHWQSKTTGLAVPTQWDFIARGKTPRQAVVDSVDTTLHYDAATSLPATGANLPITLRMLPDGRVRSDGATQFYETGWTVFVTDDRTYVRVLLFGITGTTSTLNTW